MKKMWKKNSKFKRGNFIIYFYPSKVILQKKLCAFREQKITFSILGSGSGGGVIIEMRMRGGI